MAACFFLLLVIFFSWPTEKRDSTRKREKGDAKRQPLQEKREKEWKEVVVIYSFISLAVRARVRICLSSSLSCIKDENERISQYHNYYSSHAYHCSIELILESRLSH